MANTQTSDRTTGHRALSLQHSAYELRQHAINGGDFEGWRLARRMGDAETLHQFTAAEYELGHYLQRNPLDLSKVV
jgi:hypothetical protein